MGNKSNLGSKNNNHTVTTGSMAFNRTCDGFSSSNGSYQLMKGKNNKEGSACGGGSTKNANK
jgi:hypothetical protein